MLGVFFLLNTWHVQLMSNIFNITILNFVYSYMDLSFRS
jgi:hypothetical protein